MRKTALASALIVAAGAVAVPVVADSASAEDLTALVNPLAGTLGAGFPTVAAGVPFGTVTPGAITTTPEGDDPVNYVGYSYQDPSIRGFALTHFDGAGIHIGGDLPMMPTTGAVTSSDPTKWSAPFSHASETAQPGYYSVTLPSYQTTAEMTATTHVAVERYTFPSTPQANLLFDVSRNNDTVENGSFSVVDPQTVVGSVTLPQSRGITIWFTAKFNQPFASYGTWLGSTLSDGAKSVSGSGAGGWVTFDTTSNPIVGVRVGISYVDAAGATSNVDTEAPAHTSFDSVRTAAKDLWNQRLHSIDVTGGFGRQRQTFYTCLYHAMLMPTIVDDADGRYRGFDDNIYSVEAGHHHYGDLSLWDTYRSQTPLLALAAPDVAHDLGVSLLDDTDQNNGEIPRWVRANRDYEIVAGDSGAATLATLVTDGALTRGDAERAYRGVLRQATTVDPPADARSDLPSYLKYGFVPYDVSDTGASTTLEYGVDDAAVAALAQTYGTDADVKNFTRRAEFWRNLMGPSNYLRPRNKDRGWATPTNAGVTNVWNPAFPDGWREGTGYQYLWLVPQDVLGLASAIGGTSATIDRLDQFFGTAASSEAAPVVPQAQTQASFFGVYYIGNQFTPANETDLQAPWLYNWLGEPWKTQRVLHASAQVYSDLPNGLPGNDDAGTMSAWYVLTAIGLYQAQPGVDAWELSSPLFDSVVVHPADGRELTINAAGASPADEYVGSASLNGAPLTSDWVSNNRLAGTLTYRLQTTTDTTWATTVADAPPSLTRG
jgi:predicted alpha-1,2-mannosidase